MNIKKALITALALITLFLFTACSKTGITLGEIKEKFKDNGYTIGKQQLTSSDEAINAFSASIGTTTVVVYEFKEKDQAQAFASIILTDAPIAGTKVLVEGEIYVCVAIDNLTVKNVDFSLELFKECFAE